MFVRYPLAIFVLAAASCATAASPGLSRPALIEAAVESATDNISSGWCGRGMLSILRGAGLGDRLQAGNGQDWEKNLLQAGWRPMVCATPLKAPLGSVLVYLGDARLGKVPRGTPGGYYGHVEMVALHEDGRRLYVSDCPRALPGGSVRDNFTRRAWLPPGPAIWKAPPVEDQIAVIMQERKRMALEIFVRQRVALTLVQKSAAKSSQENL